MILDTNALSAWADGLQAIKPRFEAATRLVLPTVVLGEYLFGVLQSRHEKRYQEWLSENLPRVELAAVDQTTAHEYARIRVELKRQATPIPSNDAWIAAFTRQYNLPVLSNDAHFDVVTGVQRIGF